MTAQRKKLTVINFSLVGCRVEEEQMQLKQCIAINLLPKTWIEIIQLSSSFCNITCSKACTPGC